MSLFNCYYYYYYALAQRVVDGGRFDARERKVKPLRISQSLSETFPCTGYTAFSLKGAALRGNRVVRIGI